MSTFIRQLLRRSSFLVALLLGAATTNANTYTAIASGNYTNAATWSGGIVPAVMLSNDIIDIPTGINVTLDQSVVITGTASVLNVDGGVTGATGASLVVTDASVTGAGSMSLDSIAITSSQWLNSGTITVHQLTSYGFEIVGSTVFYVTDKIYLKAGTTLLTGGSIWPSPNATLIISGGYIAPYLGTGGALVLTQPYDIIYTSDGISNSNIMSGAELYSDSLRNLEVNLPGGGVSAMDHSIQLNGELTLTAGRLRFKDLIINPNDSTEISPNGTGVLAGTPVSSITIYPSHSLAGALRFASDSNTINNYTQGAFPGSIVRLGTDLHLLGNLNVNPGLLDIDTNELTVANASQVQPGGGAFTSGYVVMRGNGHLGMNIPAGGIGDFPIGTPNHYTPARVTANAGNNSGMVSVGVTDSVYQDGGFTGIALSATQPMLNATWHVKSANSANINLKLSLMWITYENPSIMVNGFSETDSAYVAHYTNGGWDLNQAIPIGVSGIGIDTLTLDNVTSLSPFGTFSHNAVIPNANPTAIPSVVATQGVGIYPNPATTAIQVACSVPVTSATIYAADGRMIKNVLMKNNSIPVADLAPGMYYLRFTANEPLPVQQFTKR